MAVTLPTDTRSVTEPPATPTGPAAAAVVSTGIGLLAMALSHVFADAFKGFEIAVHNIGKLWMPGAQGIGPYSGKETIALVFWLGSWAILHYLLRAREVRLVQYGIAFLVLIGLATTLLWPPVVEKLVALLTGK